MSRKFDYVAAIDIGTTKIVAIVGRKNHNGKLDVLGIGRSNSRGVKRGVVLNIEETSNAIQEAVAIAEERAGIKFSNVFVGIAGQHIKSVKNRGYKYIDSEIGEITPADVESLTHDMYKIPIQAGEEIIHVIPQSYIVDNETGVKQPVGMSGRRLEANFHIVIGRVASACNIQKCIQRAGMEVNRLILEPLASADAVLTDDEKDAGVALVDIGGGTSDIAVYYDGIIRHTAVIPFGGNAVTNDIKEGCSILPRYAETLKHKFGLALADIAPTDKLVTVPGISGRDPKQISIKTLAYIIQARMEEIIDTFFFEIQNSGFVDRLGAGIVLTGGGALLKHLNQLVRFRTGLDVRIGHPNKYITTQTDNEINHAIYSTSVGLLLQGYNYLESMPVDNLQTEKNQETEDEEVDEDINLEDKAEERKESLFSTLKKSIADLFEERDSTM